MGGSRSQVAWHLPSAPLPLRTRRDTAVRFKEGEATAVQLKEQPAKQRWGPASDSAAHRALSGWPCQDGAVAARSAQAQGRGH